MGRRHSPLPRLHLQLGGGQPLPKPTSLGASLLTPAALASAPAAPCFSRLQRYTSDWQYLFPVILGPDSVMSHF